MYMTRTAKERYADYLHNDAGNTFAEYLGIDAPVIDFHREKYRYKSHKAIGTWETLKKDAKKSYKQVLLNISFKR